MTSLPFLAEKIQLQQQYFKPCIDLKHSKLISDTKQSSIIKASLDKRKVSLLQNPIYD